MAALPYMQLYVADYLADTAHLSTIEHGAYLLLIFNYWQRGESFSAKSEQSLNKRLAAVARLSSEEWEEVREALSEFFTVSETEWRHERIERDLEAVNSKSAKAVAAGKASAAARKKKSTARSSNDRSTSAQQTLNHTDTDTDKETDKNTPLTPRGGGVDALFARFWESYPRKVGKDAAHRAFKKHKPDKALLQAMLDALEIQTASDQFARDGGQYIPHPSAWLNQGRWKDDPAEYQNTPPGAASGPSRSELGNPYPQWALDAGFVNRFEAENARCFERNAHEFRGGRRVAA